MPSTKITTLIVFPPAPLWKKKLDPRHTGTSATIFALLPPPFLYTPTSLFGAMALGSSAEPQPLQSASGAFDC
jgi:hypothetical protein